MYSPRVHGMFLPCHDYQSPPSTDIIFCRRNYVRQVLWDHRDFKLRVSAFRQLTVKHRKAGTSLVVQWLRVRLPRQGTWVRALVQEDPTCCGATKPMYHNYCACALEPESHNYWAHVLQLLSPRAATTEARVPRARAPQQEKPPQWEARAPQGRAAPARCN